jgi:hypothetical protein
MDTQALLPKSTGLFRIHAIDGGSWKVRIELSRNVSPLITGDTQFLAMLRSLI